MDRPPDHLERFDRVLADAHRCKGRLRALCSLLEAQGYDVTLQRRALEAATVSVLLTYQFRDILRDVEVHARLRDKRRAERAAKRAANERKDAAAGPDSGEGHQES